ADALERLRERHGAAGLERVGVALRLVTPVLFGAARAGDLLLRVELEEGVRGQADDEAPGRFGQGRVSSGAPRKDPNSGGSALPRRRLSPAGALGVTRATSAPRGRAEERGACTSSAESRPSPRARRSPCPWARASGSPAPCARGRSWACSPWPCAGAARSSVAPGSAWSGPRPSGG